MLQQDMLESVIAMYASISPNRRDFDRERDQYLAAKIKNAPGPRW
jgi:hypothetical protein